MCIGAIALVEETWDVDGTPVARLDDGAVVSLAFVPAARAGVHVLVHLGIPVEVLDEEAARDALAARSAPLDDGGSP